MHPDRTIKRVIGGQRYNVASATLLASDEYWDGSNWERHGRNTFLYRTRGGAFFRVVLSQWEGERDILEPLSREQAMELYESLPEQVVEYEQAFDAVVDDVTGGRPAYYGEAMRLTSIRLPEAMLNWLTARPGGMSETIRALIERAMQAAA